MSGVDGKQTLLRISFSISILIFTRVKNSFYTFPSCFTIKVYFKVLFAILISNTFVNKYIEGLMIILCIYVQNALCTTVYCYRTLNFNLDQFFKSKSR